MAEKISYQKAGVDPEKAAGIISRFQEFKKGRPQDPNVLTGIGPFASCYSLKTLLQDYHDPLLVTCCDGVGTKAKLALEWDGWDRLGEDLVAMNVNDLLCTGAKPMLFLDYYACGKLSESMLLTLLKSIQAGCEMSGSSLVGGETAEMPGVYRDDDFDLAGFAVGMVEKEKMLGPHRVKVGDSILAVESSGFHSNGYSLVRKIVEKERLQPNQSPGGKLGTQTWKELLLKPTIIYEKKVRPILEKCHATAHITGGGLFENLPRILPAKTEAVIDGDAWAIPPLFRWFQEKADLSTRELLSTFNCGVGLILLCSANDESTIIQSLAKSGLRSWKIGRLESQKSESQVTWNEKNG